MGVEEYTPGKVKVMACLIDEILIEVGHQVCSAMNNDYLVYGINIDAYTSI